MLFEDSNGTLSERSETTRTTFGSVKEVLEILSFVDDKGSRSLCVPKLSQTTDSTQAA
jgi:hypothetical protein